MAPKPASKRSKLRRYLRNNPYTKAGPVKVISADGEVRYQRPMHPGEFYKAISRKTQDRRRRPGTAGRSEKV